MLPANAIDAILYKMRRNLGRGESHTYINELDLSWLNQGQKDICNSGNYWFMKARKTYTFAIGDGSEDLPTVAGGDTLDFKDDDLVFRSDSGDLVELRSMDDTDYVKLFDDTTQGTPSHFLIKASELFVRPLPNVATTIYLDYFGYLADLTDTGTANTLVTKFPDALEALGTAHGFAYLEEWDNYAKWKSLGEERIQRIQAINAERILPSEIVIRPRPGVLGSSFRRLSSWRRM